MELSSSCPREEERKPADFGDVCGLLTVGFATGSCWMKSGVAALRLAGCAGEALGDPGFYIGAETYRFSAYDSSATAIGSLGSSFIESLKFTVLSRSLILADGDLKNGL